MNLVQGSTSIVLLNWKQVLSQLWSSATQSSLYVLISNPLLQFSGKKYRFKFWNKGSLLLCPHFTLLQCSICKMTVTYHIQSHHCHQCILESHYNDQKTRYIVHCCTGMLHCCNWLKRICQSSHIRENQFTSILYAIAVIMIAHSEWLLTTSSLITAISAFSSTITSTRERDTLSISTASKWTTWTRNCN